MEKYKYAANDESLMTPFLYRFFISPMLKLVPYQIPANFITLISNSCVVVAFLIACFGYYNANFNFYALIPILCFCYLVGDCFDGVQARRTKTGSPLGEYFDHFLDSFVTGLLVGTLLFALRSKNWLTLLLPFQFLYLGQIGAFWERLKTGVISFAKISTSEGVMAIAFSSLLASFTFVQPLIVNKIFFSISIFDLVVITGFFFAGVAGVKAIIVSKDFNLKLCLHILFSYGVTFLCIYFSYSILFITLITTFYNAFFISPILSSSIGESERHPDLLVPLSFILFIFMPKYVFVISVFQLIYLSLRIIVRFSVFFYKNKHYWVWWNKECYEIDLFQKH